MTIKMRISYILTIAILCGASAARAGDFTASVNNEKGGPVESAVVYLIPASGKLQPMKENAAAIMDQINKEFVPRVLAVRVGTKVTFPNSDNIYHHVYSFSKAKTFELPLYKGRPQSPVVFDRPGAVVLGCNIHDWMKGYIYVLDTPYFAVTGKNGAAEVRGVPPGDYEAAIWHPELSGGAPPDGRKIKIGETGEQRADFKIGIKSKKRKNVAPDPSGIMQY